MSTNPPPSWCGAARRLADALQGSMDRDLCRRPRVMLTLSEAEKDRVADTLRLAQRLGGQAADPARPRDGEHDPGLCPRQQCHPDPDRQIRALALVRAAAWLGGARPDARQRRDQRHRRHGRAAMPWRPRRSRPRRRPRNGLGAITPRARRRSPSPLRRLAVQCRAVARLGQHRHGVPGAGAGERGVVRAAGRLCSRLSSARWPTISSSCRRSIPSPSPIPTMCCRSACCCSWR